MRCFLVVVVLSGLCDIVSGLIWVVIFFLDGRRVIVNGFWINYE